MLIVIAVLVILLFWMVSIYNKLVQYIEAVRNNQKQIDIQLDRRFKVFESLINTVRKAMDYEKTTLKEVVALRTQAEKAQQSGDDATRMQCENKISQIASGLSVVFEQYPDLKATGNIAQLQEEIVSTENKLAYAKQALNDSIERYNASKRSFFEAMIVKLFASVLDVNFSYWALEEGQTKKMEDYKVEL